MAMGECMASKIWLYTGWLRVDGHQAPTHIHSCDQSEL